MQQTFPVEEEARIYLSGMKGDLKVQGWDKREISLSWDDHGGDLRQEGNLLTLINSASDVQIMVPYDVEIRVDGLKGDVSARNIRRIELKDVDGDVELRDIGGNANLEYIGEAISLTDIAKDLKVQQASSLRAKRKLGGSAQLRDIRLVEIDAVWSDLELRQVNMATINSVGSDLSVSGVAESLRCGNVGGDCQISDSASADVSLGNIGGSLRLDGAAKVYIGNAGSDVEVHEVRGNIHVGNIGGDGTIGGVAGDLTVGQIGSDARLTDLNGSIRVGGIGGDLELQASFAPGSKARLHVGGDAMLNLPVPANLSLQATVGGSINSSTLHFDRHGNLVRLVYGEGLAQVSLSVGGDLHLRGGDTPRVNSSSMPWGEFSQEMADLGEGMAQLGRDLSAEFMDIFGEMSHTTFSWTDKIGHKAEEQMRRARQKAEHHARKAEQRARDAQGRTHRRAERDRRREGPFYVRVNEREWQMNPERLNDLINRAHEAAMDGVAGALEAVERAVANLSVQHPQSPGQQPPAPPTPPTPPTGMSMPPMPPAPPMGMPMPPMPMPPAPTPGSSFPPPPPLPPYPVTPTVPVTPVNTPQPAAAVEDDKAATEPDLEAEREAILRMIAEGRISPEEGDMLLEGLGN
ncbi:MAG TPA: hypothetical protein VGD98_24025 [Ktedonobacteraceae bacterium]